MMRSTGRGERVSIYLAFLSGVLNRSVQSLFILNAQAVSRFWVTVLLMNFADSPQHSRCCNMIFFIFLTVQMTGF